MRLLIADSDPTMTELYESYFSDKGYDVTAVGNGIQCIDAIREQMPDVLVLEHKLPWGAMTASSNACDKTIPLQAPRLSCSILMALAVNNSGIPTRTSEPIFTNRF